MLNINLNQYLILNIGFCTLTQEKIFKTSQKKIISGQSLHQAAHALQLHLWSVKVAVHLQRD